jgi:hypothetical protein
MAEVSIDIDAMADLVASLGSARADLAGASGSLKGSLTTVWLSTGALSPVDGLESEIDSALRDLNRRLALARLIQQSTPGMSVVTFDDSVLSTADATEVQRRVDRVLDLLKVDDDDYEMRDVDAELAQLLSENSLDPYFAKGLAEKLSPEGLDRYLNLVNQKRENMFAEGEDATKAFDLRYEQLLRGLGESLGLASRGTGEVGVPGMTEKWTDFIDDRGGARTGSVKRLSLVFERGQWSDDFITGIYRSMREIEDDDGPEVWASVGMVFDPDLEKSPGARIIDDPMYGVLRAMRHNPDAIRSLFATGDTTDVQVSDDEKVAVNKELYDFLRHRDGMSDDAAQAFMDAIATAIGSPPELGAPAFQPVLADDLKNIGDALQHEADEAEEEAGPLWSQIGHGLLDIVGMVPVLGEPADFVNGVWYYADGDVINGSLSMGALIPFAGWAATGGKWGKRVLSVEELARLNRLARNGDNIRIFTKEGKLLDNADLTLPETFAADRFLSADELARWSGDQEFMRKVIAGNRFNYFLNPRYTHSEIPLTTGNKAPFRLDSYTPGEAIVSRKLTQLGDITEGTAKGYIDEFLAKYPEGTRIADTPKTRELGINGQRLEGPMILEIPPQTGGRVPPEIIKYAEDNEIFIRDLNGHFYTEAP